MFNLAPAGDLAGEAALESPLLPLVDARHVLGAAHDYLMHANSLHSPGKS